MSEAGATIKEFWTCMVWIMLASLMRPSPSRARSLCYQLILNKSSKNQILTLIGSSTSQKHSIHATTQRGRREADLQVHQPPSSSKNRGCICIRNSCAEELLDLHMQAWHVWLQMMMIMTQLCKALQQQCLCCRSGYMKERLCHSEREVLHFDSLRILRKTVRLVFE
jgi:hypothetical protein